MQLIDTHAHLAHPLLVDKVDEICKSANSLGVEKIISIGCTLQEAEKCIELAERYKGVYATAGLYPFDVLNESDIPDDEKLARIEKMAMHKKVVAIGECGLDFSNPSPNEVERSKDAQIELFQKQIKLGARISKPIVIHSRNAVMETIDFLTESKQKEDFRAVWHCFTGNWEIAKKLIDLDIMISITGIVTYPSGKDLQEAVKYIPSEFLMIETDAPYLSPQEVRSQGKRLNKPEYVKMIAQKIAEIKGVSLEKAANTATQNANKFFNLNNPSG